MKLEKPTTPPKTLKAYALEVVGYGVDINNFDCKTLFPCVTCGGRGFKRESVSYYDMEEVICGYCKGNRVIDKHSFQVYLNSAWQIYEFNLKNYRDKKKKLQEALSKLSKEEIDLVRKYEL